MRKAMVLLALGTAVGVVGLMTGCENATSPGPVAGQGRFLLHLTDSPAQYDAVTIVVDRVEVHRDEPDSLGGWHVVNGDTNSYDLLELRNGASAVLADSVLDVGHYTQVRLHLIEGCQVVVAGVAHDLRVPSGTQSGLKLNHPFDIRDGGLYEATLDFAAERSIHQNGHGEYVLRPVIRILWHAVSGSISGVVSPAGSQSMAWTTAGDDTFYTFADTLTGFFKLVPVPVGFYDLRIIPIDVTYQDTVLSGIEVQAGEDVDLGVIELNLR